MIDTIVIMLNEADFKVLNSILFTPSTRTIFNDRFGLKKAIQNPTKKELKAGIYKPRLTLYGRYKKVYEITPRMKIGTEFSLHIPK